VMYLGNRVESGPTRAVLDNPRHHYTCALIDAVPSINPGNRRELALLMSRDSDQPNVTQGCPFAGRCPSTADRCRNEAPPYIEEQANHGYACFYPVSEIQS